MNLRVDFDQHFVSSFVKFMSLFAVVIGVTMGCAQTSKRDVTEPQGGVKSDGLMDKYDLLQEYDLLQGWSPADPVPPVVGEYDVFYMGELEEVEAPVERMPAGENCVYADSSERSIVICEKEAAPELPPQTLPRAPLQTPTVPMPVVPLGDTDLI